MKPINFPGQNCVFARNQPQYLQLPAHQSENRVTTCWFPTWRERLRLIFGAPVWLQVLNFGEPLQPQKLTVGKPKL